MLLRTEEIILNINQSLLSTIQVLGHFYSKLLFSFETIFYAEQN